MKKLLLAMLFVMAMAVTGFTAPTYNGSDGYLSLPQVDTPNLYRFGLSVKYTHSGLITPAINFVPFKQFEIGAGWDINADQNGFKPLLLSLKYQFVDQAALGFNMEIPLEDNQEFVGTIYMAWEEVFSASGLGSDSATFVLGYTIGQGNNINFGVGFQKRIFIDQVYLVADFANFPYRIQGGGNHLDDNRGILNAGIRILATDWFSIDIAGVDLFDGNRSFMVGGNLYLSI